MICLYSTDIHGFTVGRQEFDSLVEALQEFDMAKYDFSVGHLELIDEYSSPNVELKRHTTLWAMD